MYLLSVVDKLLLGETTIKLFNTFFLLFPYETVKCVYYNSFFSTHERCCGLMAN